MVTANKKIPCTKILYILRKLIITLCTRYKCGMSFLFMSVCDKIFLHGNKSQKDRKTGITKPFRKVIFDAITIFFA